MLQGDDMVGPPSAQLSATFALLLSEKMGHSSVTSEPSPRASSASQWVGKLAVAVACAEEIVRHLSVRPYQFTVMYTSTLQHTKDYHHYVTLNELCPQRW
jgi:hypothetical protein